MDTNMILTIVGIAATVLLGIGAIYLAIRYSRQVGIAYVEDTCISLIDDITQGINDLEIRFRNTPVSQNIVLLKGFIVNTGKRDISPNMVEKPLRLVLQEGFEWIDCQITHRVKDLKVEVTKVTNDGIEFSFGLLKTDEYFKFDALATVPSDDNDKVKGPTKAPNMRLRQVLGFDYRIADTHDIQKLRLRDLRTGTLLPPRIGGVLSDQRLPPILRLFSLMFSWLMGIILIVSGIGMYFLFSSIESKRIAYEIVSSNNQRIVTNARIKGESIEMYNREGFRKIVSIKEFDDLEKKTVLQSPDLRPAIVMSSTYICLGTLMLLAWCIRFVRARKYRHLLRLPGS